MTDQIKQFQGTVLEQGYGIVGKVAMKDRNLHGMAKALYAYLCTYGNNAFPGRDLICYDLGITKNTYSKHMKSLVEAGYITIKQEKTQGKFGHNVYYINQTIVPCTKICDTEKSTDSPCPKICDTKKWDTKKRYTNSTSSNNTNSNNTTTNKKTAVVVPSATPKETDEERELVAKAEASGIKKATIQKHIKQKGLSVVAEQVSNLEKAITEGNKNGKPIVNPGAWLHTALEEGFVDSKAVHEQEQAVKKAEAQERAAAMQRAAEEALLAESEEAPALDPSSPFAQIVERLGIMKAM